MHHLGYHVEIPIKSAFDDHHGTGPAPRSAQWERQVLYPCHSAFEKACWVPLVLGHCVVVVRHDAACSTVASHQAF